MIRERPVCEGVAWMVPPTFTAQHKGFFYDKARDRPVFYDRPEMAAAKEAWRTPEADMPGFVPRSRGRCEYRP